MFGLSTRLVCLALLASATSLLSYAAPALAQIPLTPALQPELDPAPAPESAAGVAAPASSAAELPPAPAAPPGTAIAPPSANAPPPAKTDRLTTRSREGTLDADRDSDVDAEVAPKRRWYGWETLTSDGVSLTMVVVGVALASNDSGRDTAASDVAFLGVLNYEFGPGIIHFLHRNPGRGFASMGLRFAMPVAGGFVGASAASGCNGFFCQAGAAAVGLLAGMGGAIAIDAAVFAYDDPKRSRYARVSLTPLVTVLPGRAWVGVFGQL